MQCKYCGTQITKKDTRCPQCGRAIVKPEKNIRPIAIAGVVIAFVGSAFPMIMNSNADLKFQPAFGFMNYESPWMWYSFLLLCVLSVVLCAVKLEKFSIAPTAILGVLCGITYNNVCLRHGAPGMVMGLAPILVYAGCAIGVIGVFLDVLKFKKKEISSDYRYTGHKTVWQRIYIYRWFYLMFLPVLVFVIIFNYLPMTGLRYAFMDFKSGSEPSYVGIKHFVDMFGLSEISKLSSKQFMRAFGNTLTLSVIKLAMNTFAAVLISLLLHEMKNIYFKKSVQTIIYLPHFMSWVVVASIFKMALSANDSGLVNSLLMSLGVIDKRIDFLTSNNLWRGVYYVVNLWKDTGWGTILFLATLSGISPELYEAADIDGANRFNKMRYITMPALANTIITVFILNLAKVMNLFESVFVMYNPSVYDTSDVIQTYIYRQSFASSGTPNYGYTTAVGLFKSLIGCILVLICNKASKKVRGRGIV
ncbi:MAG: ABC transporter permease subunit [Lachnospiraceae bacterium]|nr:ABC transporter permease subunit [Lachnospiraceae bacterium]